MPQTKTKQTKTAAAKTTKSPKGRKTAAESEGKLSCLDAAAKVLSEATEPMSTKQMIETMAGQKLWSSPNGQTPEATLYSAILREINTKGDESRFQKTDRGRFAFRRAGG